MKTVAQLLALVVALCLSVPLAAKIVPVPAADEAYGKQDYAGAAKLWQAACDSGNMTGCYELAIVYRDGEGVQADAKKTLALFEQACKPDGDGRACFNLANAYEEGTGVAKSVSKAVAYLEAGCSAGFMESCGNLGVRYMRGDGVAKDEKRGVALYGQACDNGAARACYFLAALYDGHQNKPIREDPALANAALLKGCEQGDPDSCQDLGYHYKEGYGVKRDDAIAGSLLAAACDDATSIDCSMLSKHRFDGGRYDGKNVREEFRLAAGLYNAACEKGFAHGCFNLVRVIRRSGKGEESYDQLVALLEKALTLNPGYKVAQDMMKLVKAHIPPPSRR